MLLGEFIWRANAFYRRNLVRIDAYTEDVQQIAIALCCHFLPGDVAVVVGVLYQIVLVIFLCRVIIQQRIDLHIKFFIGSAFAFFVVIPPICGKKRCAIAAIPLCMVILSEGNARFCDFLTVKTSLREALRDRLGTGDFFTTAITEKAHAPSEDRCFTPGNKK